MGECILAGHPQGGGIKYGTYTGDGQEARTISLGTTPKWVLVFDSEGKTQEKSSNAATIVGGLALAGNPSGYINVNQYAIEIVDGGFKVVNKTYSGSGSYQTYFWTNHANYSYRYLYGV